MTRHIKSVDRQAPGRRRRRGLLLRRPGARGLDPQLRRGRRHAGVHPAARGRHDVVPPLPGRLGQGPAVDPRLDHAPRPRGQPDRQAACCGASSAGSTRPPATRSTSSGPTCSTARGGDGWLYWILSGVQDDGTLYPDYDGFTVYCPSPVCTTLTNAGEELRGPQRSRPPVADHDTAVVEFNQPATLTPAANDVAYRTLRPSIDLDPAIAGAAATRRAGGTFALGAGGAVTFTPAAGLRRPGDRPLHDPRRGRPDVQRGRAVGDRQARPDRGRRRSRPSRPAREGWAPGNWLPDAGVLTQTADFHPQGAYGLHLDVTAGHWFGVSFAEPLDLSGKSADRLRAAHRRQRHVGLPRPAGRAVVHVVPERRSRSSSRTRRPRSRSDLLHRLVACARHARRCPCRSTSSSTRARTTSTTSGPCSAEPSRYGSATMMHMLSKQVTEPVL